MEIRKMIINDYEDIYNLWISCKGVELNNLDDSKEGIESFINNKNITKNKKEVNHMIKIKYNNNIYYDEGRGSNYDGYVFYTDKTLTEKILRFDIITQFGVAIHSSLGDNPYNRELSQKEKEWIEKYSKNFEKMKELYKKAVANPDVEQRFSY